jgi:hypothetical protein
MEFQVLKIYVPDTKTWINVEPLSDIHIGSKFFDKVKFMEVRDRIRDNPTRYTFIMGDIFDSTLPDNKFFDVETQDPELPTIEDQFQWILKALMPIRHKILGVHTGNHDERVRLKHFDNVVLRLVNELNKPHGEIMDDYPESVAPPLRLDENGQKIPIKFLGYMALTRLVLVRPTSTPVSTSTLGMVVTAVVGLVATSIIKKTSHLAGAPMSTCPVILTNSSSIRSRKFQWTSLVISRRL